VFDGTLLQFVANRLSHIGPKLFGALGYHMWFLGYLFAFSLLALPFFIWLKRETGQRFIARLAGLCGRRGAILLFILPLAAVRLALHPFFPEEHDWADFFSLGAFFVLGYLMFADVRFTQAIRRDRWIILGAGIAAMVALMAVGMSLGSLDIEKPPRTFSEFLFWGLMAACGWCWSAFMLFIGMRYLDRDNKARQYGQEILLPFFVLHQTVIIAIAYFAVQWNTGMLPKMLAVYLGSFVVTIGLCELVIKRVGILRVLFGMKGGRPVEAQTAAGLSAHEIQADSA
jgi:hypothetical protein